MLVRAENAAATVASADVEVDEWVGFAAPGRGSAERRL